MEEALTKLKEIGYREIGEKTHIAHNRVLAILDKQYGSFDRTTALGFVRILEREYEVDLSEWVQEFENYRATQNSAQSPQNAEGKSIDVDFKYATSMSKYLEKTWLRRFLMLLLFLVVGFAGYYVYQQHFKSFSHILPPSTGINPELSSATDSLEAARALYDGTSSAQEIPAVQGNLAENGEETNVKNSVSVEIPTPNVEAGGSPLASETTQESTPSESQEGGNERGISLHIEHRMWLGIIYLDRRERITDTVLGDYKIDTTRNQLILTGHGVFALTNNGKTRQYNGGSPMRFKYDVKKGLSMITLEEFMAQNGGREW
ncbi:MAG: hypothetical protein ACTTH5_04360 [Wolinella sp.]